MQSVPKMPVGRYAGTPVDQLPNGYLRWVVMQDFPKEIIEVAKRKLAESPYNNAYLNVSRHAYDQFSLRFIYKWLHPYQHGLTKDGIGTFLVKQAEEAWLKGTDVSKRRHKDDGIVKLWQEIKWVFAVSPNFPDYKELITVMPDDDRK